MKRLLSFFLILTVLTASFPGAVNATNILTRINGISASVAFKAPVRVATTAAITLSGLQDIDGETLVEGDFVLVKNQFNSVENGIYVASARDWQRRADFDGARDCVNGTGIYVMEGSNGLYYWRVQSDELEPVVGTDEITFVKILFQSEADLIATQAARDAALQAAADAEAARDQINDSLSGTSTTSLSIGSGTKVFTTQDDLAFGAGSYILATSDANPTTHKMGGTVTSYSGTTLTVSMDYFVGSGTRADWTIRISGPQGATGAAGSPGAGTGDMLKSENLSGLANYATARSNLGLGNIATTDLIDEDSFATNSASRAPSQQSVKAYVDSQVTAAPTIEFWEGTPITPGTNINTTEAHTLSGKPNLYKLFAVCITPELGFEVGDEVEVTLPHFNGSNNYGGFGLMVDDSEVTIMHGIELTYRRMDTAGPISSLTKSRWNLIARAWLFPAP